jgi:DNA polymerase I-like protein with 3'-5' exonuclease and polymerase domains
MSFIPVDMKNVYAADFETFLMGPQNLCPPGICFSIAVKKDLVDILSHLIADGDDNWHEYLKGLIDAAIEDEEMILVFHNAKYDLHVLGAMYPDYYHKICVLYDRGQIVCTILVEKLMNLVTTGWVDKEPIDSDDEEGKGRKIEYNLAFLINEYLGIDVTMDKKKEDAVRKRYQELAGLKAQYYPKEFKDYAIHDSEYLLKIFELQMSKREMIWNALGIDPLATLAHRCSLDFHLYRFSIEGVRTNPEQIAKLHEMLKVELSYEKLNLLYPEYTLEGDDWNDFDKVDQYLKVDREKAFLKPSYPKRPGFTWSHKKGCPKEKDEHGMYTCGSECFRRGTRDHVEGCKKKVDKFTREFLCDCPPKYVQSEKMLMSGKEYILDENGEKIPIQKDMLNTKLLKKHMLDLWYDREEDFDLMFSAKAKDRKGNWVESEMVDWDHYKEGTVPKNAAYNAVFKNIDRIATKAEWMDIYAFKDPILAQYAHRASLIKLQTTELPRMTDRTTGEVAEVVHGNFDVLKETGRTSGFASSLYPSANLQNVHKMARTCFRAREGHWILSTDYSGLEFVSAAQRALNLLGESVYAKVINSGWDSHSYLAAQRAVRSEEFFRQEVTEAGLDLHQHEEIYHLFMKYKGVNDKSLGYYEGKIDDQGNPVEKKFWKHYRNSAKPIGLGLLGGMGAKTIAHVSAAQYGIEMTPEEAQEYKEIWEEIFYPEAQLLKMVNRDMVDHEFSTRKKKKFRYETPMGMVRPNCSYAACANGSILQSPSAEGATLAMIEIAKACYDPESTSILKGNFKPWAFVHDEVLGDVPADPAIATAVAKEVERIMVEQLRIICPDIHPTADSALMITWNKAADDVFNKDGLLVPFEVKKDKQLAAELNYAA